MKATTAHVIGLDIIRFSAALMVMVFHLAYWSWAPAHSLTKDISGGIVAFPSMAELTWFGWVGVEIFFVISGFVIAYSAAGASPASFLRSRILRLYPAAWVCATATLATVLVIGANDASTVEAYARTMVLWVQGPWIDGVYWTLGIEIIFYAVVFVALCLGGRAALPFVFSVLALISAAFWGGLAAGRVWPQTLPLAALQDLLNSSLSAFLLLRHGCFFALGGLLWLSQTRRPTPWLIFVAGLCLASGVVEILASARDIVLPIGDTALHRAMACAVWLAAVAAMAIAIFCNGRIQKAVGKTSEIIKTMGLMTYPVYLLHDIIGAVLMRTAYAAGVPALVALALAMVIVLVLGWLVTQFFEPPIRRQLRVMLSGARSPGIEVSQRVVGK